MCRGIQCDEFIDNRPTWRFDWYNIWSANALLAKEVGTKIEAPNVRDITPCTLREKEAKAQTFALKVGHVTLWTLGAKEARVLIGALEEEG